MSHFTPQRDRFSNRRAPLRGARATIITILGIASCQILQAEPQISSKHRQRAVFGGEVSQLTFDVADGADFRGTVSWALFVERRLVARRVQEIPQTKDPLTTITLAVELPQPKPGVTVSAAILAQLVDENDAPQGDGHIQRISVFSPKAFAHERSWLEALDLVLFDPKGNTASVFQKSGIPHHRIVNREQIGHLESRRLVIGEGVSLPEYLGLMEQLIERASAGSRVLVLAPRGGEFQLPTTSADGGARPTQVRLNDSRRIEAFDKRLDPQFWAPTDENPGTRFVQAAQRESVIWRAEQSAAGWPWLEVAFGETNGILAICGFPIVSRWDDGPDPRYLLLRIFEYLDGSTGF